jgi:DNA-binding Xre family transcriptional regulator
MATSKSGCVYAIGMAGSPYVKIGSTASTIEKRLKQLQTGHPHPLVPLASVCVQDHLTQVEQCVRVFLAEERERLAGEWFVGMMTTEQLTALVHRAEQYIATVVRDHPSSTPSWNIAQRVEQCRKTKGWTRGELARRAKLNPTHLWKILSGQRPRVEAMTVKRLARSLEVTTDYLLGMDIADDEEDAA